MDQFNKNPFISRNAEEEVEYINDVFYEIPFYIALKDLMTSNVSRFVTGKRGDGKSMIIHKTINHVRSKNILPILITNYDLIPENSKVNHFIYLIVREIVFEISKMLFDDKKLRKKLNETQAAQLSILIQMFYDKDIAMHFEAKATEIKHINSSNWWKNIFNKRMIKVMNDIINSGYTVVSNSIYQQCGLPTIDVVKLNILEELELTEIKTVDINSFTESKSDDYAKRLLFIAVGCVKSLGVNNVVVLFDKIDEITKLGGNIENITEFIKPVLLDTDLLTSKELSLIFSLWSQLKKDLSNKGVRFDKFSNEEIFWSEKDLYQMINKRLNYFSEGKINDLRTLIPNEIQFDQVIRLGNGSPRALLELLSKIHICNSSELPYDSSNLSKTIHEYCANFDYTSLSPNINSNSKNNTIDWINKLLHMRLVEFNIDNYKQSLNVKNNATLQKHINELVRLGLIIRNCADSNSYKVVDRRIEYLIVNGITNI